MGRAPAADLVVQITTDPDSADLKVGVVADQVLEATAALAGQVATVQPDGTWGVDALPAAGAVADLVNSTGGTTDGTVVTLTNVGAPALLSGSAALVDVNARLASINNNMAELTGTVNTLLAALRASGQLAE